MLVSSTYEAGAQFERGLQAGAGEARLKSEGDLSWCLLGEFALRLMDETPVDTESLVAPPMLERPLERQLGQSRVESQANRLILGERGHGLPPNSFGISHSELNTPDMRDGTGPCSVRWLM